MSSKKNWERGFRLHPEILQWYFPQVVTAVATFHAGKSALWIAYKNGNFIFVHYMKAYRGVELHFYSFLTYGFPAREWWVSPTGCLTPEICPPIPIV